MKIYREESQQTTVVGEPVDEFVHLQTTRGKETYQQDLDDMNLDDEKIERFIRNGEVISASIPRVSLQTYRRNLQCSPDKDIIVAVSSIYTEPEKCWALQEIACMH